MSTVAFDTLAFSQQLEDAGVEPKVAKATSMVVADAQKALIEGPLDGLAKKSDFDQLEIRLSNRMLNTALP